MPCAPSNASGSRQQQNRPDDATRRVATDAEVVADMAVLAGLTATNSNTGDLARQGNSTAPSACGASRPQLRGVNCWLTYTNARPKKR
jgi:hypothetical protein